LTLDNIYNYRIWDGRVPRSASLEGIANLFIELGLRDPAPEMTDGQGWPVREAMNTLRALCDRLGK
jgi:hypothetical protein